MEINTKVYGGYARVIVDGEQVKSFSLLAEDYAITLARDYAAHLKYCEEQKNKEKRP